MGYQFGSLAEWQSQAPAKRLIVTGFDSRVVLQARMAEQAYAAVSKAAQF